MASSKHSGSLESIGSQHRDPFVNLERRRDRHVAYTHSEGAPSVHSEHTGQHEASHHLRDEEVHNLKKKVERSGRKYYCKKSRTPPRRGQRQDVMRKVLLQISRSSFSQRIKQAKLLCRFNQPTFTIYNGFDVKRVMVNQGSGAEIMYPDLFKTGDKVVSVDFIVVDAFSPYTAILARSWLHAMGVVSSTLHVKNPKEVQRLTGMTTALNKFISRFAKRCRPLFQLLHKWKDFSWSEECDEAFEELKAYLAYLLVLSRPEKEEVLYACVAIAQHAVSLILIWVDEGIQKPVYYVSKSLQEAEVRSDYIDLVVGFTEELDGSEEVRKPKKVVRVGSVVVQQAWQLFMDGAANQKGSGIGIMMISLDGITLEKSLRLDFSTTNNEADFEALLARLITMQKLGGRIIRAYYDSRLIAGQVPRSKNSHVDSLATLATISRENLPRIILVEDYALPAYDISVSIGVNFTRVGPSWMDPLIAFLKSGILPEEKTKAERICRKASRFWLFEDKKLYKRSYSRPYLLCIHPEVMETLLEELHKGFVSNGQAEATNKVIMDALKKSLEDAKGKWVDELPHVLWTYRTTPRRSTSEIPFSLSYGSEAVIPKETGFPTLRSNQLLGGSNERLMSLDLDLAEEQREVAVVRLAPYQQKLKKGFEKGIKVRVFIPGDHVLRRVVGSMKNPSWEKLGPNWEWPNQVTSIIGTGAYRLEDLDEIVIPRTWNVNNLRKYYF
ncbi:uncharacterized protein LOC142635083 [Castanea sativa]|uniref:uncharacterized protein LOC142635083 n=1 Tax=Castanea sativa TaxID=21020 RepID=UPI003F650704